MPLLCLGDMMSTLQDPSREAIVVTPSDTTDISGGRYTRAIYVGGSGGTLVVVMNETDITFTGVPAGSILPIRCTRVKSTGTTVAAGGIVALF